MDVEEGPMEGKAVHSWSRISSTGKRALEEALRVFSPMSKDLTNTESQLVSFLQGLREEGYQPTVLSSKDVYGYNSTTADTPPSTKKVPASKGTASTLSASSKTQSKNSSSKVSATSVALSVNAPKVPSKPRAKATTNLLLRSLKQAESENSKSVGISSNLYPAGYPPMRLSVVLEALVPLEAKLKQHNTMVSSAKQSSKAKCPDGASERVDSKTYQFVIKKMPTLENHVSPQNAAVLKGPSGRILKENNACKASDLLNGHVIRNPSKNCNGISQSHNNLKVPKDVTGKVQNKDGLHQDANAGRKRKHAEGVSEAPLDKKMRCYIPLDKRAALNKDKYNVLQSKVIKVDKSSTDDEVRQRAQEILKLNLSPVIRIQPLSLAVP
ncbi:coiled-coil domain-containing protein 71 [Spea bombifrons]|uniref:coiled-coil domain-containing protein 71 n=1 Tax=Spea bombifrons TaxID=233779 RepID=UPI00234AB54E|nr:coiled-coil domain-containing protein 71 [Spea bombifrons]XP_053325928.1 coiled-coil domain-containing protein 71 [Spea bombifrons]